MQLENLLNELRHTDSIRSGALLLERAGQLIGLPKVGCAHDISLPAGPEDDEGTRLADIWGWPHPFAEEWEEQYLTLHTPFFLRCRFEHLPFAWSASEYLADPGASRRGKKIVRFMVSVGYANTVIAPVHLPQGRVAAISWWGDLGRPDLDGLVDRMGPTLLSISHYFIAVLGNQARPAADREASPPSVREIECLTLAAQGLSDLEIAHEMRISVHTVRYYINTVTRRLGARNRTHAVALASQLGTIRLSTPSRIPGRANS